jgi:hypothetical protein
LVDFIFLGVVDVVINLFIILVFRGRVIRCNNVFHLHHKLLEDLLLVEPVFKELLDGSGLKVGFLGAG